MPHNHDHPNHPRAPQKSFRLSPAALAQLDALMEWTGLSKTRVVEEALALLHRQTYGRAESPRTATNAEIEAALDAAKGAPLSEEQVRRIMEKMKGGA